MTCARGQWRLRSALCGLLAVLSFVTACSTGEDRDLANEKQLNRLLADPAVQLLPPGAVVIDRGQLQPCQTGSRSDDWGEVVVMFETGRSFEEVSNFYRSQLATLGWTEAATQAYGADTLIFTAANPNKATQLRLSTIKTHVGRYMLLAEIPPARDC